MRQLRFVCDQRILYDERQTLCITYQNIFYNKK